MKVFSTKRDKVIILIIFLIVIFFFGIRLYLKTSQQGKEVVKENSPLALNWLSYNEGRHDRGL